jgi:plasmid stability protein
MSSIQVRGVPDELHRSLKRRAAEAGLTLSDYVLEELRAVAQRPSMREWLDEASRFEPSELSMTPAEALAAERRAP